MSPKRNPSQLSIFPEISGDLAAPSIATIPEFDKALGNLIKMSDLGAFIQINIQGIEKIYSLNLHELHTPPDFLQNNITPAPITVHLFPQDTRNEIKKLTYEVKAFFNRGNSFKTSFGYFLFRSHFPSWKTYLQERQDALNQYLSDTLSKGVYGQYFLDHFQQGYDYFKDAADETAPWVFRDKILLKDIQEIRNNLMETQTTLSLLKATDLDFPFHALVLKTAHIPMVLHQFQSQVHVHSVFKTIHLEYLSDNDINTIEDVRKLTEKL
ncbi:MAG TPA: hypothetical protein QGF08_04005 [Candidatus Marinimicrobia bacterium]|jgi:hypothetical protein|nr:hypothetical protein [Candidatus Neomarinimicrobiota bacterium]MDP7216667.1 hypothetical protein [Candidatus Neomarinimicrobiota bacterium]MDP7437650.1 hypothetical protein [Candidatus Neomarinimicrobiota bacterium]HJM70030.1 hypothetical protein [Candidatus Neomarinimicrobiota bacterium]|tara:strand:+ start:5585 stop:6388 length:804 start_codon:yes stop_codon:yes gene_type:complete